MIRFRSLLSGVLLCAASTTSLWAQVPSNQSPATLPVEIPIISARTAHGGQANVPPPSGSLSNQTAQGFLQGLNGKPNQDSPSLSLLPPIVKPGEQPRSATSKTEITPRIVKPGEALNFTKQPIAKPSDQSSSAKLEKAPADVPVVKGPTATSSSSNAAKSSPPPSSPPNFAPYFKAEHPDLSLPTGVQIVKPEQVAKPSSDKPADNPVPGSNSPEPSLKPAAAASANAANAAQPALPLAARAQEKSSKSEQAETAKSVPPIVSVPASPSAPPVISAPPIVSAPPVVSAPARAAAPLIPSVQPKSVAPATVSVPATAAAPATSAAPVDAAVPPSVAVPIVKSAALVKTAEASAASPAPIPPATRELSPAPSAEPKSAAAPTQPASPELAQDVGPVPQFGAAPPSSRAEIALPPIRPGEEFPRTKPNTTVPAQVQNAPLPTVAKTSPATTPRFEAVPVGSGAAPLPGQFPSSAIPGESAALPLVMPAQPLLTPAPPTSPRQLPATVYPAEIGPEQQLQGQHVHGDHVHGDPMYSDEVQSGQVYGEQGASPVGQNYLSEVDNGGCTSCGGVGCSHCGMGRWNGLGNRELVQMGGGCDGGCFGLMPCAKNYFIGDVLYWTRNGGDVVGTDFGGVYNYDWNFGTQVTMGTRTDPLYGHEIVYFGLFQLDAGNTAFSPTGAIDARFNPTGGLGFGQTYAFFDGEEATQTASSRLHSFQLNRTRLGWDVVQSHLGLRYIWFEDEYQLQSRNVFGESGRLALDARNQLIGPEVGVKLFYDVGRRISFSSHWKLGGYLNAYRTSTLLENDGVRELSNSDSGTGFSASFDLGANVHVHLTQRMRLRGGYGILWLWDVASVTGNFPSTLTPSSGTSTNDSESAIFHGANVGFEYYW